VTNIEVLDDPAEAVADLLVHASGDIVLTGGSSPQKAYELAAARRSDWSDVTVWFTDERCVPPDHPDSNFRMADQPLLSRVPLRPENIHRMRGEIDPNEAAIEYGRLLKDRFRDHGCDLTFLGMGDDGHTASLFPHAPELAEALRTQARCIAVTPPAAPHRRMSLSARALLEARNVFIDITGPGKWSTYERAASPGPIEEMPVRLMLQQQTVPVHVYWSP